MRQSAQKARLSLGMIAVAIGVGAAVTLLASIWLGPRTARTWIAIPLGVVLGLFVAGRRATNDSWKSRWAKEHGAFGEPEEQEILDRYIKRQRALGSFTFAATLIAVLVTKSLMGTPFGGLGIMPALVFIGTAFQPLSLLFERTSRPTRTNAPRRASLVPRTFADYAEPWLPTAMRASAIFAVALAALWLVVPHRPSTFPFNATGVLAVAAATLFMTIACEWIQKVRIREAQPFTSAAVIRADDINRSISIRGNLYGCLIADAVAIGFEIRAIGVAGTNDSLHATLPDVGIGFAVLAGIALWALTRRPWKITRAVESSHAR